MGRKFSPCERLDGGTLGIRSKVNSSGSLGPQPGNANVARQRQLVNSSKVLSPCAIVVRAIGLQVILFFIKTINGRAAGS